MASTTYKTRIVLRTDTTLNWENKNPPLLIGEMGYAIDGTVVTCCKVGIGVSWKSTPILLTPFKPIVTNYGRNLDAKDGGTPYDAKHNFQTEDEAWQYVLYPYSPPSVNFPATIIWDSEVGDNYNMYQTIQYPFDFNIFNTPSIFLEGTPGVKKYYIDSTAIAIAGNQAVGFPLTDQNAATVLQTHYKTFVANSNVTGNVQVIKASVRGSKNPSATSSVYDAYAYVRFRIRSATFLYRRNTELFDTNKYPDTALSSILRGLGNNITGGRYTTMADGGGNKYFGTIPWDTVAYIAAGANTPPNNDAIKGNDGFFHICIMAPLSAGVPRMYTPSAGPTGKQTLQVRNFMYTNGTATGVNAIPYALYMTMPDDAINGTYTTIID